MITKNSDQKNLAPKNFVQINIDKSSGSAISLKDLIDKFVILNSFQDPWISSFPSYVAVRIVLEKNVSVEIIDDIIDFETLFAAASKPHGLSSLGTNGAVNPTKPQGEDGFGIEHEIEFDLQENSKLFYICKLKPQLNLEYNQAILQELGDSNSNLTKRLILNLNGSNAHAKIRIRSLAVSSQKFKFQTLQNHLHADTSSCLCIKNVLFGNAKIECDNKIKVHEDACKSFANQVNRNLIIGQNAHVISSPQLEIENDDVKCRHGAVTKVIDEEQLFYLQNRGIDSLVAKQLLVKGFLS